MITRKEVLHPPWIKRGSLLVTSRWSLLQFAVWLFICDFWSIVQMRFVQIIVTRIHYSQSLIHPDNPVAVLSTMLPWLSLCICCLSSMSLYSRGGMGQYFAGKGGSHGCSQSPILCQATTNSLWHWGKSCPDDCLLYVFHQNLAYSDYKWQLYKCAICLYVDIDL